MSKASKRRGEWDGRERERGGRVGVVKERGVSGMRGE